MLFEYLAVAARTALLDNWRKMLADGIERPHRSRSSGICATNPNTSPWIVSAQQTLPQALPRPHRSAVETEVGRLLVRPRLVRLGIDPEDFQAEARVSSRAEQADEVLALHRALAELPERWRLAVREKFFGGRSAQEIGLDLGVSGPAPASSRTRRSPGCGTRLAAGPGGDT
jgi:hypothetical protein